MSASPVDDEAPIYRGKTLTPESPRPLHVPSPANIPVLENQIDPIFNLMCTHIEPPHSTKNLTQMDQELASSSATVPMHLNTMQATGAEMNGGQQEFTGTATANGTMSSQDQSIKPDLPSTLDQNKVAEAADSAHMTIVDTSATELANHFANSSLPTQSESSSENALKSADAAAISLSATTSSPSASLQASTHQQIVSNGNEVHNVASEGVQALLDSLTVPQAVQPDAAGTSTHAPQTVNHGAPSNADEAASLSTANSPAAIAGLPPRPPPQEKPAIHPDYASGADIRTFHFPQLASNAPGTAASPPDPSLPAPPALVALGANGLPAPPVPSFQQPIGAPGQIPAPGTVSAPDLATATPASLTTMSIGDVEAKYHSFLDEESAFAANGALDQFPPGSRLFVGNLPTEIVTKREIFEIFHKYGKLAQISIKQAYGFVQFMDAEACRRALREEQNQRIKERYMHLEISKPPKNRNALASTAGDRPRDRNRRGSRSPDRRPGSRSQRGGSNRNQPYNDFREEARRSRDDYRPGRSPSPRRRDDYRPRDRSSDRHHDGRRRSRSPYGRGYGRRSPSPRRTSLDADDGLALPRRAPRDVPDVQIILLEDVSGGFIDFVLRGFRDKNIRSDVLTMPRAPLDAVIKRQIHEGVVAVCQLTRMNERTGKIDIRVFDRSRGPHDIRFEDYNDLEPMIAAELALRAKSQTSPTPTYGSGPSAYVPPYAQQPPAPPAASGLANLITTLDAPALQQLLGAMQQQSTPTQSGFPSVAASQPDISALLANLNPQQQAAMQQAIPLAYPYSQNGQQQSQTPQQPSYGYPPATFSAQSSSGGVQYGQSPPGQPQVQSIMDQLATLQRKG